jgi:hypothetical protein
MIPLTRCPQEVIANNEAGFTLNADIAQGQIDILELALQELHDNQIQILEKTIGKLANNTK